MTSTVTSKDDDSQLLRFSGSELVAHVLQSKVSCAVDYACIVTSDDVELKPNETSLTDDVFSVLLGIQHLADKLATSHPDH
jgi:hypothetical protein